VLGSMRTVMGRLVLPPWLRILGWLSALLMVGATIGMLII
jgi:Mn2+/Fe2+ NRAMP family transporter